MAHHMKEVTSVTLTTAKQMTFLAEVIGQMAHTQRRILRWSSLSWDGIMDEVLAAIEPNFYKGTEMGR